MAQFSIVATPVFKITLARFHAFLTRKYSEAFASETQNKVKNHLKNHLTLHPLLGPPSDRLLEFGIKNYRQLLIDTHNIVFYKVDEEKKKVILLAIIDSRQNIEKLLYEVNIISPDFLKKF